MISNQLQNYLVTTIFRTLSLQKFEFKWRDDLPCRKTEQRRVRDRRVKRIERELDVLHFIRFHFQMRGLLKILSSLEQRNATKLAGKFLINPEPGQESVTSDDYKGPEKLE